MSTALGHQPGSKPLPGQRMTFEEFLDAEFDHNNYEWVDGEAVEMAAVEDLHARAKGYLYRLLADYVEAKALGELLDEPFVMRTKPGGRGRSPDVLFVATANLGRVERRFLNGPADLVIEVTSAGSRTLDRQGKFDEYEAGGVPEYWIVDPLRKQAEFFVLENGSYALADLDADGRFHSRALPGLWIDVEWLWTRPPKADVLKLWGVP